MSKMSVGPNVKRAIIERLKAKAARERAESARLGSRATIEAKPTLTADRLTRLAAVELAVDPDDIPVDGNASAIDAKTDRAILEHIRAELDAGNVWAWCVVTVTASYDGLEGIATLGACSYPDERAFRKSPDFVELRREALADLVKQYRARASEIELDADRLAEQPGEISMSEQPAILAVYRARRVYVSSRLGHTTSPWQEGLTKPENYAAAAYEHAHRYGVTATHELVGARLPKDTGYAFICIPREGSGS